MKVGRNTVDRYLADQEPGVRSPVSKRRPEHDAIEARIVEILDDSPRWTHGKQKLTARRLWRMLTEDEGIKIGYTFVKDVVRSYRRRGREVFVPLVYRAGELAEVDFFEVVVDLQGVRQKAFLFVMRLMFSGRDFAFLYPRQDATCFIDAHVRAFAHFGGVPWRIIYDNLKPAVARVLVGSDRILTKRFQSLAAHYAFEPCFARPATGHDKGGVEARGKGIRWQHLVPVPIGDTLPSMSERLQARMDAATDDSRLEEERRHLLPLPPRPYASAKTSVASISRQALVKIEGAAYSVPSEHAGLSATVHVGVFDVDIVCPDGRRVRHRRVPFGGKSVDYRHYLAELRKKPQAVRQVADVLVGQLGPSFVVLWRELAENVGEKEAARRLAKILGAIHEQGLDVVEERLRSGLVLQQQEQEPPRLAEVPDALRRFEVEKADVRGYDALLGGAQ